MNEHKHTTKHFERLLVVLDPTSEDGERGAELALDLVGDEGHVELAVALSGPEAWALHAFAEAEDVSAAEAAVIYLDQAVERLGPRAVGATTVDGQDLPQDLVGAVSRAGANGAVLPAQMAARVLASISSWAAMPFPVVVVPQRSAA